MLELETLEERRVTMVSNFAAKTLKHPVHRNLFKFSVPNNTRSGKKVKVIEPHSRTVRYAKSSIPAISRYINQHLSDHL